ncbi:GNAT family N-acetyltransferase [Streptomyces piniterrae]|uniref:GNAT family N-acetyltransferase n=1 Tax=Streptomyces piniterrae TaxID=2571125 RepID=A0A4U0NFA6_9ACTN|nr:GNAT family N-acetyltransferase [Streptomyces piniterrae]TJZ52786.1 GNAT family N-acetyltransferase [Streptomyces piniterrae]
MSIEVRTVGDDDIPGWITALAGGFLHPPVATDEDVAFRTAHYDPARTQGAYDGGRCVATFRSFAQELTVVGGARLSADAVTGVTVSPTHRRRGLLTRMVENDLRAAKERGDTVSTLIAAEYPIYGRFGYGPAAWTTSWRIDVARTRLDPRHAAPESGGRIDFATSEEVRALGPGLHDRFRVRVPGAVSRTDAWWDRNTGTVRLPSSPWTERHNAVYRSPSGEIEGLACFTVKARWEAKRPENTALVDGLIATTPAAERALWQFLCSIDWVLHVDTGNRGPDDLLPHFLGDPRAAAVQDHSDFLWLRPLDVPRMLEARTYPVSGSLVLEVEDRAGLAGGRFLLDAGPDGATCTPTTRSAQLALGVGELATLYLGDAPASRLAALGTVREERAGAVATADLLLHTAARPWCPDMF